MENPVWDELEAVSRQHEEAAKARWAAELAAIRARQDEFNPAVHAVVHQKRPYQPRKPREGLGPDLCRSDRHVLVRLSQLNDCGISEVTVTELAAQTGYSRRQVQYSLRKLEDQRLIRRQLRPSPNPRRHQPSTLTLLPLGWVCLNRIPPANHCSDVSAQKIAHPSEIKINNSCTKVERSAADAAHTGARATPSAAARAPSNPDNPDAAARSRSTTGKELGRDLDQAPDTEASTRINAPAEAGNKLLQTDFHRLARQAAAILHPSRAPILHAIDPYRVIDAARRQRFSLFDPDAWARAVGAHGRETALLAAALAMLRMRDGRGQPIRSAASYLGGMLRQPPGALNPIPSLISILHGAHSNAY